MIHLNDLYKTIRSPLTTDSFEFSAVPIYQGTKHRLAKDKSDNPVILLSVAEATSTSITANIKLQNVSVMFDLKCKVQDLETVLEKKYTIIYFTGKDASLRTYFLKLCSSLIDQVGNEPTRQEIRKEITRFIELFRLAVEPEIKTIQGLWSELFLISESNNPLVLLKCWHCIPEEKFDFNNGEERIEVKSSQNGMRMHNFRLEQLHTPNGTKTLIASILVKRSSSGKSIETLQEEILARISGQTEYAEKLCSQVALTLGKSITESSNVKFDYHLAKDSLRFYWTDDIPKIPLDAIPASVYDVCFKCDLGLVNPVNLSELENDCGLHGSIA